MFKVEGVKIIVIYDLVNVVLIVKELNCVVIVMMEVFCIYFDVDCVIIVLLNYLYKVLVIVVVKVGKYVFCEKFIVLNYQDCKDMVDVCKEVGVIFMVGYVMNFFYGVCYVKVFIKVGEIGEVI